MSGGNCPETPRQKMIGMMYLFLTAMLALNVSGELLKAFVSLDEGFNESRITIERKNNALYNMFSNSYKSNKEKVGEYWEKAQKIQEEANHIVGHIQELKVLFAQTAGGPEATPELYNGIDNQDIAPQLMITEGAGKRSEELKEKITHYKEVLLSYLDATRDSALYGTINKVFNVEDVSGEGKDVEKSWESTKFEHMPLAASMAMLSKIQGDARNLEADVVGNIFNKIDQNSFKFTKVAPMVIPTSTEILKGNKYEAKLLFAGYDETNLPRVKINGQTFDRFEDGMAVVELPGGKVGKNEWKGTMTMKGPDGNPYTSDISGSYNVNQPNVVISPIKMNVFYEGVDNPVEISVPGVSASDIIVSMSNVNKRKKGDTWIVKPNPGSAGKKSTISVSVELDGGKTQRIGSQQFRIKRVPNPVAMVAGVTGGKVRKNVILAQQAVFAEMEDFDFDLEFKVTSFTVSALKGGFIVDERSKSNKLTQAQKDLIGGLSRGSKVSFESIRAKGPDGSTRSLGTVTLVVD